MGTRPDTSVRALRRRRDALLTIWLAFLDELDKADKFDALYGLRSNFLHDGSGRDSLGDAADATLEIAYTLQGI
jgi:hypothetical protein